MSKRTVNEKIVKIRPVDPEIISLRVIIKKVINASKIYGPSGKGKFAEWAKNLIRASLILQCSTVIDLPDIKTLYQPDGTR